jgi:hypothetical protein
MTIKSIDKRVEALEKNFEALITLVQAFGDRVKELDTFLRLQAEKSQEQ